MDFDVSYGPGIFGGFRVSAEPLVAARHFFGDAGQSDPPLIGGSGIHHR